MSEMKDIIIKLEKLLADNLTREELIALRQYIDGTDAYLLFNRALNLKRNNV